MRKLILAAALSLALPALPFAAPTALAADVSPKETVKTGKGVKKPAGVKVGKTNVAKSLKKQGKL